MRDAEQLELVVEHAEGRVVLEIDALHVSAHRGVAQGDAEAQPPVLGAKREEVPLKRGALAQGKLLDDDCGAHHVDSAPVCATRRLRTPRAQFLMLYRSPRVRARRKRIPFRKRTARGIRRAQAWHEKIY